MSRLDVGGDPPSRANRLDDGDHHVDGGQGAPGCEPMVVDLGTEALGAGGAVWSLPHGGDLDANL